MGGVPGGCGIDMRPGFPPRTCPKHRQAVSGGGRTGSPPDMVAEWRRASDAALAQARAQLAGRARGAALGAVLLAMAGAVATGATLVLAAMAVLGLASWAPAWLAALI